MAKLQPEQHPVELGVRLRALRREHPTLAVLTEIIRLDEARVTIRATVRIDGETRAQGHAAQGADLAADFVAAAERRAVEQALLLGGFDLAVNEPLGGDAAAGLDAAPTIPAPAADENIVAADDPAAPPKRQRRRAERAIERDHSAPETVESVDRGSPPAPDSTDAAASATRAEADAGDGPPSSALLPPPDPPDSPDSPDPLEAAAPVTPPPAEEVQADTSDAAGTPVPAPPPRRKPARQARPPDAAVPDDAQAASASANVGRETSGEAQPSDAELVVDHAPPPTRPRRAPARTVPAPPTPAVAEVQTPQAAARAAWRAGQPIPAWWPADRIAVEKPLTRAQVERLRAVAIDEEITAAQLDAYSAMIFGRATAELNQAEGSILEERLNPAYPSPLQDLRARRVLHPLAVGDTVTIPADSSAFVRWRDIPPIEEAPPAPTVPSWRTGGIKRVRKRPRR